jgi:hypothetical protein
LWLAALAVVPWREHVPEFLFIFGTTFAAYLYAVRHVLARPLPSRAGLLILGAGVLFRVTAFLAPPSLSDDVYRYLWDGRVQVAGMSPYAHAPDDPALSGLRTADWEGINHKNVSTIYPPLAQGAFFIGAWFYQSPAVQRALFCGFDLLTAFLLLFLLRRRGLPESRVLIYAWNPLVIVEFASSGHVDSLGIAALVAGFLALEAGRTRWGGVAWGLGFLAKLGTGILLPWVFLSREGRRALGSFLLTIATGYGLYAMSPLGEWRKLLGSTTVYATSWSFNAGLFDLISFLTPLSSLGLRVLCGSVVLGAAAWMAARRSAPPFAQAGFLFAAALALSPVVHPWYALWLLPFLCVYPWKAGIVFTGLAALSYLVWPRHDGGLGWTLPAWVRIIEYGVPAGLLLWEGRRGR